jgi:hypothetical protein
VESPNVEAGGALLRLPLVFAATPTARYAADAIVGPALRSYPAEGASNFGIRWIGEPNFDIESIGSWISRAYAAMASFYNSQADRSGCSCERIPAPPSVSAGQAS